MKQYQLAMPQQVFSGETGMQALESLASGHEKAVVFTDAGIRASGILERPLAELDKAAVPYIINNTLPAEPTCDQAQQVIDTFRESNADLIVAVGGGSVMDIAKLASITADGSCTVRDQLKNPRIGKKTVTTVMIPTTAGTGSEATPFAVITDEKTGVKYPHRQGGGGCRQHGGSAGGASAACGCSHSGRKYDSPPAPKNCSLYRHRRAVPRH